MFEFEPYPQSEPIPPVARWSEPPPPPRHGPPRRGGLELLAALSLAVLGVVAVERHRVDEPAPHAADPTGERPVLFTEAARAGGDGHAVALVPESAVVRVSAQPVVFVREADDRFLVVPVELGAAVGADREILRGVTPGQEIVAEGGWALTDELGRGASRGGPLLTRR